jgi:protein tyrosine phosphatase (PTP) superfamily phosphohydrolase (DUF442 family)
MADPDHIKRFGLLEPWLTRGAQPDDEGYRWLANYGIKTVVNLRLHNDEEKIAKLAPELASIHIPVINDLAPSEEQALYFLQVCADASMRPFFVHCKEGEGRTSAFCVLARLSQGRRLDEAVAEQIPFGFKPWAEHRAQGRFLARFAGALQDGRIEVYRL